MKLDFNLKTDTERTQFVTQYLKTLPSDALTPENLDLMASYILWGKNPDGLNTDQLHLTQTPTKHTSWGPQRTESLDALSESPLFEEASVRPLNAVPYKVPRVVFDRAKALKAAPDSLKPQLTSLFRQIDETEFGLNQWELMNGRRVKPPRPALVKNLDLKTQQAIQAQAATWSHYWYLKMKHKLVELRRSQYALSDAFKAPRLRPSINHTFGFVKSEAPLTVFPLGTPSQCPHIWRPLEELTPQWVEEISALTQSLISDFWWGQRKKAQNRNDLETWINLGDLTHLSAIFTALDDLALSDDFEDPSWRELVDALKFYVRETPLSAPQALIVDLKLRHYHNVDIAAAVNKRFGTSYTPNYISTIWNTKILARIAETIQIHSQLISSIWFERDFKKCSRCGRIKLKHERYYGKQARSLDGWSTRCKCCEKELRELKKFKKMRENSRV